METDPGELDTMVSIIEGFLHRNFILDPAARNLGQSYQNGPGKSRRDAPEQAVSIRLWLHVHLARPALRLVLT
jgi:hypothetical protein